MYRVCLKSPVIGRIRTDGIPRESEIPSFADIPSIPNRVGWNIDKRDLRYVVPDLTGLGLMNDGIACFRLEVSFRLVDSTGDGEFPLDVSFGSFEVGADGTFEGCV